MLIQLGPQDLCQAIVEQHPDAVFVVDSQTHILYANRAPNGGPATGLLGRSIEQLLHADHRPQFHMFLSDAIRSAKVYHCTIAVLGGRTGHERTQCRISALQRQGRTLGGLVVMTCVAPPAQLEPGPTVIDMEMETPYNLVVLCAWCKRIRDHEDCWADVEDYLRLEHHTTVSHGICPQCFGKYSGEMPKQP